MAWYNEDSPETLNFALIGNHHSGYGLLQAALSAHPAMICHGDVFHEDEEIRRSEHAQYFGSNGKFVDHFMPTELSVEQYLNNKIFDNTLHGEQVVGVKINYDLLHDYDLWDYMDQRSRQGDFCVVHVQRNPVACLVAKQQQRQTEIQAPRLPVYLEPAMLTEFCRRHVSATLKLERCCPDRAVVPYHELLLDFRGVLERLLAFLSLKFSPACVPNCRRVQRRDIPQRIANWQDLRSRVPADVREFLDDPLLY